MAQVLGNQSIIQFPQPSGPPTANNLTQAAAAALLDIGQTPAEASDSLTPTLPYLPYVYDVRRAGIVPNVLTAAAANSAALKALGNPANPGPIGQWIFPNTTGADVYYFAGMHAIRDGVAIDLQGSTLSNTYTGSSADGGAGFLTAQRNFSIANGSIIQNYTYTTGADVGNILMFGGRGAQPNLFPAAVYDATLSVAMGNLSVKNIRFSLTSTYSTSRAILMLGGINGLLVEGCYFQGNASGAEAFYCEYGYATQETDQSAMQTSHPHNLAFRNNWVDNFTYSSFSGLGAYNVVIDGLIVTRSGALGFYWGVGQANFFRPWAGPASVGTDVAGAKHGIYVKNVVIDSPVSTGMQFTGDAGGVSGGSGLASAGGLWNTWTASHAYVSNLQANGTYDNSVVINGGNLYVVANGHGGTSAGSGGPTGTGTGIVDGGVTWNYVPLSFVTDLLDVVVENVVVRNAGGYGIACSGVTRLSVHDATLTGCQRGMVTDQETTLYTIEGCTILNSTSFGIQIGQQYAIYNPPRQSMGKIRDCFIAGSGTAGASAAIVLGTTIECSIESCRFGYETIHDGVSETTQLQAVSAGTDAFGVTVKDCYIAGVSSGTSFNLSSVGGSSRASRIQRCSFNNVALQSATGLWLTDWQSPTGAGGLQTIATNGTIYWSLSATTNPVRSVRVGQAAAVTGIILQAGGFPDQRLTVLNEGAFSITFAASGTSNVADGVSDVIATLTAREFIWDQNNSWWYRAS
jgi:hypothetical protein